MSIRVRQTRHVRRSKSAWPLSREASTGWRLPAAWQRRTPCSARLLHQGAISWSRTTRTGAPIGCLPEFIDAGGLAADPAHLSNLDSVASAITPGETTAVWIETPTNPLLNIADIAAIVDLAHAADALVIVDNTFATPYLQQPLELGADVVVHSTTKYCGGHSDIVGGALVVNDDELADQLRFHQNAIGGVASPFDCWLVLRGLRTLAVRMDRHCDNAEQVAAFLNDHPRVAEVYFPGLDAHPGHDLAKRQMRRYGGMISFRVAGGEPAALQVCEGTSVIILGESLGGVESLIEHPHTMTHASVAGTQLEVPGDLIRLSVGIEDVEDLIADLDRALG